MKFIFTIPLLLFGLVVHSQNDSLVFTNQNIMIGEVKSMNKGVLTMETDYSDSDFKIEWDKVSKFYSKSHYLITLMDGRRLNGTIGTNDPPLWQIYRVTGDTIGVRRDDIVYFKSYKSDFWSRLTASIDLNYSFTKANNFNQIGGTLALKYVAPKWSLDGGYSILRSNQDDVDLTLRTDGNLSFRKFLPKDHYYSVIFSFLSNTEQLLDLRSNLKAGVGKYIIHTNASYLGIEAGISAVNENFTGQEGSQKSLEAYAGTEYNMFDVGDFDLLTRMVLYRSITESNRWRVDYSLDMKYDLPLDFYIKGSLTLNYDNKAIEGAKNLDYVVQTGIGWEFN